jgi:hypothetical protein
MALDDGNVAAPSLTAAWSRRLTPAATPAAFTAKRLHGKAQRLCDAFGVRHSPRGPLKIV